MPQKEKRFFVVLFSLVLVFLIVGIVFLAVKGDEDRAETTKRAQRKETEIQSSETMETQVSEKTSGQQENIVTLPENTEDSTSEEDIPVSTSEAVTDTSAETSETPAPPETTPSETPAPVNDAEPPVIGSVSPIPLRSWISQRFLKINEYSRPAMPLEGVNNIVIHWVGNPGSDAEGNREYFENLQYNEKIGVSSHFIIGLNGEILYIVPTSEVAYCNYPRNMDTISIENCHPDWNGQFNQATYDSLIRLCSYLCEQYGLTADALIRHHDVSGKDCPRFYVEHPEYWEQLKNDVRSYMSAHPDILNELP